MERRLEITGSTLMSLFWTLSLACLVALVALVAWPFDGIGSVALAVLLVSLGVLMVVGLWRRRADRGGLHLGTDEDIAFDPIAYPGQAAKHRWLKAVRRLPDGDDED